MKRILIVGEDALCCALGEQLVQQLLPGWQMPIPSINKRGITKLVPDLPRFLAQARNVQPVLCLADTDGKCPKTLLANWLPKAKPPTHFSLRLAVHESESWLLADRQAFADFFGISEKLVARYPDEETDAKRHLLYLATRAKNRDIRQEVVSQTDSSKQGNGYNQHLCGFVNHHWSAQRAAEYSPSLARAVRRIAALPPFAV